MFKSKLASIISFIILIALTNKIDIQEEEKYPSKFEFNSKGGITTLNNQEIYINFFGYEDMPNKKTIWKKNNEGQSVILKYTNKNNIHFIQKWNFENKRQPKLELIITKPNEKLNLRYEIIITTKNPTKECQILINLDKEEYKANQSLPLTTIINKEGWISINNDQHIFAIKINKDKLEIEQDQIRVYKENLNAEVIKENYQFNSSSAQYFILKNQKEFKDLEKNVDFGYYLYKISKPIYIIGKKIQATFDNIVLTILLIIILIGLAFAPFSIESIEMQKKFEAMQPELSAINNLSHLNFTQKQLMIKEIHNRYGYDQIIHFLGQILLIIGLTIFQSVFGAIEFINILPNTTLINITVIIALCTTVVFYNNILFKNNQAFITALFTLFFIGYPKLPLVGFILLHWFNIALYYLYKLSNCERN